MIFNIFLITFLINVTGNIILIPLFGAEGAAITYLFAIVVQLILFCTKTEVPGLENNRFIFLVPAAAIASAAVPSIILEQTSLILIASLVFFFFLLFFMKVLCRNDWLALKKITTI